MIDSFGKTLKDLKEMNEDEFKDFLDRNAKIYRPDLGHAYIVTDYSEVKVFIDPFEIYKKEYYNELLEAIGGDKDGLQNLLYNVHEVLKLKNFNYHDAFDYFYYLLDNTLWIDEYTINYAEFVNRNSLNLLNHYHESIETLSDKNLFFDELLKSKESVINSFEGAIEYLIIKRERYINGYNAVKQIITDKVV